jgi:hypothetical protein
MKQALCAACLAIALLMFGCEGSEVRVAQRPKGYASRFRCSAPLTPTRCVAAMTM